MGPDNGVLTLAASDDGVMRVFEIATKRYTISGPSKTFAGRDFFAPVAAYLANGVHIGEIGPEIEKFQTLSIPKPTVAEGHVVGEVFIVDSFGNIITNIRSSDVESRIEPGQLLKVEMRGAVKDISFASIYEDVERGQALVLIGSSGFLEISVNRGNASLMFKAKQGDSIKVTLPS